MKVLLYSFFAVFLLIFSACESPVNPPLAVEAVSVDLKIVDQDGKDLLQPNLELSEDGGYVSSPFLLTASCNNKKVTIERLRYSADDSKIILDVQLYRFNYSADENLAGVVTFNLKLPSVLGENKEVLVEAQWEVGEKNDWGLPTKILGVKVNGEPVEYPIATLVVNK